MSSIMVNREEVEELVTKIVKSYNNPQDLAEQLTLLKKLTLEKILEEEMDEHLGYEKYSVSGRNKKNSRNGYSSKTIRTEEESLEIIIAKDR